MKIVHVSRQYHPGIGGLESFTRNLCEEQARVGHQVRMVTLDRIFDGDGATLPARERINGVDVVRLPFRGGRRYPFAPLALAHLDDCDIVHVHAVDFFVDYLALTRLWHRKPMVLSTHGGFFHTPYAQRLKHAYFHTISRFSLSQFRAVIACSHADRDIFARVCGRRLALVENGVDIAKFAGLGQADARTIIYFGRIAPNKRLDLLVGWFAALRKLDPSWTLIVAGKPMGVSLADLRLLADRNGASDAIEFHESPTDDALKALIARSSLFASASAYEGFGISLIEAVSAGLYPVVSDIPAHRRSCEKLGVGSLIDFADPFSPARLLQQLRSQRIRDGLAAAQGPMQSYGWPHIARQISDVYDQIIGHRSRRIGAVDVAVRSRQQAIAQVGDMIRQKEPRIVAFCNAHTATLARNDERLSAALRPALVLNDGVGVDFASRLRYGGGFPDNLNGTDFIPQMIGDHGGQLRLFLLGAAPGVAEQAGRRLAAHFAHVRIVGTQHGFFDEREEPSLAQRISASEADAVIACMGNPRQEIWAARWVAELRRPVICGGAFLDFTAGRVRRAPLWLRRARLEWIYRLIQEPTRLSDRYVKGNLDFIAHAIRDAWVGPRWEGAPPPPPAQVRGANAA